MSEIDLPEIIGEIEFNYDEDKKEFCENPNGRNQRIVNIYGCVNEDGRLHLSLSCVLGRKKDDTISLSFDGEELLRKLQQALIFGEDNRK